MSNPEWLVCEDVALPRHEIKTGDNGLRIEPSLGRGKIL
jgi:hypothetical protein